MSGGEGFVDVFAVRRAFKSGDRNFHARRIGNACSASPEKLKGRAHATSLEVVYLRAPALMKQNGLRSHKAGIAHLFQKLSQNPVSLRRQAA